MLKCFFSATGKKCFEFIMENINKEDNKKADRNYKTIS